MSRVFLLSPANCGGRRAQQALSVTAQFDVAVRLRSREGVPIGDLFAFMSGLYFRGKLAYARRFAAPPDAGNPIVGSGVHIITPSAGLRSPDTPITADAVRAFSQASVDAANEAYRRPLEQSARALLAEIGDTEVVLLGSIASPKYVDVLLGIFGDRLFFPVDFVGRGDMSRGGLMLRQVASGDELVYVPVAGAVRRGQRPPRLAPLEGPAEAGPHDQSSGPPHDQSTGQPGPRQG
ncbi:MAG TPA: hypothetical protein VM032_01585 [Vicinamibacterales bacterium]|nr:hypothetical protein [Vicinamibacterales bacterium]